jgi:hypothetical protein
LFQRRQHLVFTASTRKPQRLLQSDLGGDRLVHECLEAREPEQFEHSPGLGGIRTDMALREVSGGG